MTQPKLSITVCLLTLLAMATASWYARVPETLAQPKAFRAYGIAGTDPQFENADSWPIAQRATLELGRIEGHGQITSTDCP